MTGSLFVGTSGVDERLSACLADLDEVEPLLLVPDPEPMLSSVLVREMVEVGREADDEGRDVVPDVCEVAVGGLLERLLRVDIADVEAATEGGLSVSAWDADEPARDLRRGLPMSGTVKRSIAELDAMEVFLAAGASVVGLLLGSVLVRRDSFFSTFDKAEERVWLELSPPLLVARDDRGDDTVFDARFALDTGVVMGSLPPRRFSASSSI